MNEYKVDKTAIAKWRKIVRIRKIIRYSALISLPLAFWLLVGYLWHAYGDFRFAFSSFMVKWTNGIIQLFGSVPENLAKRYETTFVVAFFAVSLFFFIFILMEVNKVKKVIIENKADEYSEHFKNIGFTNKKGGTPRYICKASDPNSVNGIVYTFDDEDIDIAKLEDPEIIRGLRNTFHGHVGCDFATYGRLKICVTPSEKITCTPLTTDDTWIADHINACGVFGAPGMGKTVGLAYLTFLFCKEAEKNNKSMEIVLMDQKLTFAQKLGIEDSPSFYYGERVLDGLEDAVATLDKVKLIPDGKVRLYVIDEMVTFLERLADRKRSERAKSLISTLVFEGREYNFKIILAGQSSHAERFNAGVRESLTSKFFYGSPSPNEQLMLYPSDVGLMDARNSIGEGYFRIDAIMQHVERFTIKDAVPDFAEIGKLVRKYMR